MRPSHITEITQGESPESTNVRESGYELLRIISMIMILAFHTFRYIDTSHFNRWQMLAYHGVRWYGLFGVNCFLMISAWFMIGKPAKTQKLLGLVLQTAFYCILLFLCHIIYNIARGTFHPATDIADIELTSLLSPLWSDRYWFITAYIFLYLMVPFINRFIQELPAGTFRRILLLASLFIFLYQSLPQTIENTTVPGDIIWAAYVYFLTAYLKLYGDGNAIQRHAGTLLPLTYLIFVLTKQLLTYNVHNTHLITLLSHTTGNSMRYSFWMLLLAVELFYLFQRIHFKNRHVNTIAACMFGVYLFHENKVFHICELLAENLLKPFMKAVPSLALFMLALVMLQFTAGCLLELLRQHIMKHRLEPYIYKKLDGILCHWDNRLNRF